MTEELKARIAQINAGTVPAGYKKTKVGIVPEEWEICHFKKQFARLKRKNTEGNTNVLTISAQYGLINQEDFFKKEVASEDKSNYYLLFRGDFAYNKSYSNGYPFGAFKMLDRYDSGVVSPLYICFKPTESNECPAFYVQYFENGMMNREIQAVAQEGARNHGLLNISIDDFFNSYLLCPPLPEQQKIAEILTAQDAVIALMQKQIELLQKQKKAFLQKMFPKKGCNVPEIRFAGFTDAWEQRKLSDMVERVTRKNENLESELPLTISAQYGLIDQNEFFDKRIASRDVSGYYLLKKGEFAYNKSTSSDAPWGAVKRLDRYEMGVLSTLYIVFALKEDGNIDSDFLVSYYDTDCWHKGVQAIAAEGARNHGLLNITPADYFETVLTVPSNVKEQHQIGTFFAKLDTLITLHQRKLEIEQQKKKALMQLLLTGKVRVTK